VQKVSAFYNWKDGSDFSPSFIRKGPLFIVSFPVAEKLYKNMGYLNSTLFLSCFNRDFSQRG